MAFRRARLFLIVSLACYAQDGRQVTVLVDLSRPVNRIDPRQSLGAGLDGHEHGEVMKMLAPRNAEAMLSAGLKPLTYRLRTELAAEAWHWNPEGAWSEASHRQGYWTSSSQAKGPLQLSYGYRLPRRGNTGDQANNDGYSRLDDGDPGSFWKSNPYLDEHFTGESNALHPPWVVIDLGRITAIDTLQILWGEPHATSFVVEYAGGNGIEINSQTQWQPLARAGDIKGGKTVTTLSSMPLQLRFLRIVMTSGSNTAAGISNDVRDSLGVAIREVYLGVTDKSGRFHDAIRHSKDHGQTVMYVSSTDPWHRETDRDLSIEQPGFDFIFKGKLTNGLPMLVALPLLYDTPENSLALIKFLKSRGYPVEEIELGEEPEEQYCMPQDYGALWIEWSRAIHGADPALKIGGASLVLLASNQTPEPAWTKRLFAYLRERSVLGDFAFFSFEWYPFDEVCDPVAPQLMQSTELLRAAVERLHRDGIPREMPLYVTEYGYSAYGSEAEVDLPGALLNADVVGAFFAAGGARTYLYGYEPNELLNEKGCTWGNNMLFLMGEKGEIAHRMPVYYAAQLLAREWMSPAGGVHEIFNAESGNPAVTAYAVRRPDGAWAILCINKDPQRSWKLKVAFRDGVAPWKAPMDLYQYSPAQYIWKPAKDEGHPLRNEPPAHTSLHDETIELPPYSLSVIRSSAGK